MFSTKIRLHIKACDLRRRPPTIALIYLCSTSVMFLQSPFKICLIGDEVIQVICSRGANWTASRYSIYSQNNEGILSSIIHFA